MRERSPIWISIAAWGVVALAPAAAQTPAVLVKDIEPGLAAGAILSIESRVVFGDKVYFAADTTSGSPTVRARELKSSSTSPASSPASERRTTAGIRSSRSPDPRWPASIGKASLG